jgi:hypothetical protein
VENGSTDKNKAEASKSTMKKATGMKASGKAIFKMAREKYSSGMALTT